VYDYGLDDRAIEVRSPAEANEFFLKRLCPDRLWGPPSLLYNGYRGSFLRGKARPGRVVGQLLSSSSGNNTNFFQPGTVYHTAPTFIFRILFPWLKTSYRQHFWITKRGTQTFQKNAALRCNPLNSYQRVLGVFNSLIRPTGLQSCVIRCITVRKTHDFACAVAENAS
jgi:hypothetical protein